MLLPGLPIRWGGRGITKVALTVALVCFLACISISGVLFEGKVRTWGRGWGELLSYAPPQFRLPGAPKEDKVQVYPPFNPPAFRKLDNGEDWIPFGYHRDESHVTKKDQDEAMATLVAAEGATIYPALKVSPKHAVEDHEKVNGKGLLFSACDKDPHHLLCSHYPIGQYTPEYVKASLGKNVKILGVIRGVDGDTSAVETQGRENAPETHFAYTQRWLNNEEPLVDPDKAHPLRLRDLPPETPPEERVAPEYWKAYYGANVLPLNKEEAATKYTYRWPRLPGTPKLNSGVDASTQRIIEKSTGFASSLKSSPAGFMSARQTMLEQEWQPEEIKSYKMTKEECGKKWGAVWVEHNGPCIQHPNYYTQYTEEECKRRQGRWVDNVCTDWNIADQYGHRKANVVVTNPVAPPHYNPADDGLYNDLKIECERAFLKWENGKCNEAPNQATDSVIKTSDQYGFLTSDQYNTHVLGRAKAVRASLASVTTPADQSPRIAIFASGCKARNGIVHYAKLANKVQCIAAGGCTFADQYSSAYDCNRALPSNILAEIDLQRQEQVVRPPPPELEPQAPEDVVPGFRNADLHGQDVGVFAKGQASSSGPDEKGQWTEGVNHGNGDAAYQYNHETGELQWSPPKGVMVDETGHDRAKQPNGEVDQFGHRAAGMTSRVKEEMGSYTDLNAAGEADQYGFRKPLKKRTHKKQRNPFLIDHLGRQQRAGRMWSKGVDINTGELYWRNLNTGTIMWDDPVKFKTEKPADTLTLMKHSRPYAVIDRKTGDTKIVTPSMGQSLRGTWSGTPGGNSYWTPIFTNAAAGAGVKVFNPYVKDSNNCGGATGDCLGYDSVEPDMFSPDEGWDPKVMRGDAFDPNDETRDKAQRAQQWLQDSIPRGNQVPSWKPAKPDADGSAQRTYDAVFASERTDSVGSNSAAGGQKSSIRGGGGGGGEGSLNLDRGSAGGADGGRGGGGCDKTVQAGCDHVPRELRVGERQGRLQSLASIYGVHISKDDAQKYFGKDYEREYELTKMGGGESASAKSAQGGPAQAQGQEEQVTWPEKVKYWSADDARKHPVEPLREQWCKWGTQMVKCKAGKNGAYTTHWDDSGPVWGSGEVNTHTMVGWGVWDLPPKQPWQSQEE